MLIKLIRKQCKVEIWFWEFLLRIRMSPMYFVLESLSSTLNTFLNGNEINETNLIQWQFLKSLWTRNHPVQSGGRHTYMQTLYPCSERDEDVFKCNSSVILSTVIPVSTSLLGCRCWPVVDEERKEWMHMEIKVMN